MYLSFRKTGIFTYLKYLVELSSHSSEHANLSLLVAYVMFYSLACAGILQQHAVSVFRIEMFLEYLLCTRSAVFLRNICTNLTDLMAAFTRRTQHEYNYFLL